MLLATFFTNVFYSATYPYIYQKILSGITDKAVAVNNMVCCISIIIFSTLWNKYSDRLFKYYGVLCFLECVLNICMAVYITSHVDMLTYYIMDTTIVCLITRNIICGGTKLRAIRYPDEKSREHFDNSQNSVSSLATIIGSLIAIKLDLNFTTMLWIATFGNIVDNLFYIWIFRHLNST